LCPDQDGNDDGKDCALGDIPAAHGFWLNMAREGHSQGGLGGALKVAAGVAASTLLDYSGATTVDQSAATIADPGASVGAKARALGKAAVVVASNLASAGVLRAASSGRLQEVGHATKILGNNPGYRGSRLYGLRNAAGQAAGTDKYGFYFAIDNSGHMLHIGPWKW
jgi:hypothetical protein